MSYQPPQQPPVTPGYPAQPPQGDWTPPPAKKRGPLPWLIGALVVLVLAGGGVAAALASGSGTPAAGPTTATAAAPLPQDACGGGVCQTEQAGTVAAVADGNAVAACHAAWKAFSNDRLMTTDILAVEQPARETANAEIKAAGAALLDAYRIAVIAKANGDSDALTTEIELTTASAEMNTACFKAGVDID